MNKNFFVTRNDGKKLLFLLMDLAGIPGRYCHMEKDSIRLALTVCFLISAEEDLSQRVMAVYRK